jgi:hypothetical protein
MWADEAQVLDITNVTVEPETLRVANYMIENFTGRVAGATPATASPKTSTRDAVWLGRAVAYQAAWLPGQPGILERMDVTHSVSTSLTVTAAELSPFARTALARCSFNRSRSIPVRNGMTRPGCDDEDDLDGSRWEMI